MGGCLEAKGAQFVRPLLPNSEDYFVLKPMHSAFYMTPLDVLLQHLQVELIILTGLTSNNCITATAHDANMRGFNIYIPPDCSCTRNREEHTQALAQLEVTAGASLQPSTSLKLPKLNPGSANNGRVPRGSPGKSATRVAPSATLQISLCWTTPEVPPGEQANVALAAKPNQSTHSSVAL
jgi:hypothetical protein